jgi:uroporphyrinogen-III synthase
MDKLLSGLTVIITRPIGQSKNLQQLILKQGGTPVLFPTIEIQKIQEGEFKRIIMDINQYELLIFMSQNAVDNFAPFLPNDLKPKIAAIGPATARALIRYQLSIDFTPKHFDSEHLLFLLQKLNIKDKSILILSGEGGRTLLETELAVLGAKVKKLPVYRRLCPSTHDHLLDSIVKQKNSIILSTSCESFSNLLEICRRHSTEKWLNKMRILVISERIKAFLESLGFHPQQLLVASNATDQAILERLIKWYAN